MRIVIIGGHGKVAQLLEPALVEDGQDVTAFIRKQEQVKDIEQTGANAQVFDVENASSQQLQEAFAGADAIVFAAGAGGGSPERTEAVDRDSAIASMEAAQKAGVKRFVLVSYYGAGRVNRVGEDDSFYTYQEAKAAADKHLRSTDLDWTVVGPAMLTDEPASSGVTPVDPQEARPDQAKTSRALVAEVIRNVLTNPNAIGETLDFTDGTLPISQWIDEVHEGKLPGSAGEYDDGSPLRAAGSPHGA